MDEIGPEEQGKLSQKSLASRRPPPQLGETEGAFTLFNPRFNILALVVSGEQVGQRQDVSLTERDKGAVVESVVTRPAQQGQTHRIGALAQLLARHIQGFSSAADLNPDRVSPNLLA